MLTENFTCENAISKFLPIMQPVITPRHMHSTRSQAVARIANGTASVTG